MDLVFRIYVFKCFIKVMTNVCGVWILKLFYTILHETVHNVINFRLCFALHGVALIFDIPYLTIFHKNLKLYPTVCIILLFYSINISTWMWKLLASLFYMSSAKVVDKTCQIQELLDKNWTSAFKDVFGSFFYFG